MTHKGQHLQHWHPPSLPTAKQFQLSFTFHLLFQGETSMDLLQFCLHGQPTDISLQMSAVHHADAKHYECDVLRLRAHQAPPPSSCSQGLVGCGWLLLLVLKYNFAQRLWGPVSTFWRNQGNVFIAAGWFFYAQKYLTESKANSLCKEHIMSLHQFTYFLFRIYISINVNCLTSS